MSLEWSEQSSAVRLPILRESSRPVFAYGLQEKRWCRIHSASLGSNKSPARKGRASAESGSRVGQTKAPRKPVRTKVPSVRTLEHSSQCAEFSISKLLRRSGCQARKCSRILLAH